jgi:putative membrane protein (TIGR04086 family)
MAKGLINTGKVVLIQYILTALMILIMGFIMYKLKLDDGKISVGVIAMYIIINFIGGFLMGKKMQNKKLAWGILAGTIYFGILLVLACVFTKEAFGGTAGTVRVMLICICSGAAGGMVA